MTGSGSAEPQSVVANPGGISWLITGASALARTGGLRAYFAPAATSAAEIDALRRRLPGPIGARVVSELSRRAVPATVPGEVVERVATGFEVAYVLALRAGRSPRALDLAFRAVFGRFDRAVASRLRANDEVVLGYSGATLKTFERAKQLGIRTILDYPIAHYETCERLLSEEKRLVPEYAATVQGDRYEPWRRRKFPVEIALADRILALSTFHRNSFLEAGVEPDRLVDCPLGVDVELFRPGPRADDGVFRIAFVGQITQRKGISYAVEGFRRAAIPNSELVFIGRPVGPPEPWIGVPGVRHVPAIPRSELPAMLRTADVFVLPSLIEGLAASGLEAMATGLPVVVSENAFGRDVVTEGVEGHVVPIRDADAIAERLRHLHADPDRRRRMGVAARAKAEEYSYERYGERLVGVVRALNGRG